MLISATEALQRVQRWADLHRQDLLTDLELANSFLCVLLEAELSASDDCLAALPQSVRPVLRLLRELAARAWYDDRHRYIADGRTLEQRQAHYRSMQAHYRLVGEHLLARLGNETTAGDEVR
jgi:hypothetical protein